MIIERWRHNYAVFYDKYIAPKTKTSKDDEILETLLRILPEELSKKLLGEKEGDK